MTTANDLILSGWDDEDDEDIEMAQLAKSRSEFAKAYAAAKGRDLGDTPTDDRSRFFDPVRGHDYDPEDELPWLVSSSTKVPRLVSEKVDPSEDQHNIRWSME